MNYKSIGDYLKSLREEKGLSLEDIAQATKIKIRFLQDIERNKFDNLGGVGYAKAMTYTYGRYLKADLNELLKMLDKKFPETILPDFEDNTQQDTPKKYFLSTAIIPVIIILIFAIVFAFVIVKTGHSPAKSFRQKITTQKLIKPQKSVKNQKLDTKVLKDTTDYLEKFLFKKKKNPFKADE